MSKIGGWPPNEHRDRSGNGSAGACCCSRLLGFVYVAYVYLTLPDVRALAKTNPTDDRVHAAARRQRRAMTGRKFAIRQQWVPYRRISPFLRRAVIVTEDAAFFDHDGIDLDEIRASLEKNWEEGQFLRGGSTHHAAAGEEPLSVADRATRCARSKELLIARRLEAALTKQRIFEIYLNMIEWGDGIFGCEAAARAYFGKSCAALGMQEAALLAGAIINPRVHSPAKPTRRLLRRQQIILRRMGFKEPPPAAARADESDADRESDHSGAAAVSVARSTPVRQRSAHRRRAMAAASNGTPSSPA